MEPTVGNLTGSVKVETVQGTLVTQRVDALVLPMIDDDPLFICAVQTLDKVVRSELIDRFKKENRGWEVELGHFVLVKNFPGLQCKAVIFLSLTPWNDDPEGVAVQVLRLGIKEVLSFCDSRGFGSVTFPALGVGNALRFPDGFMTQVLKKEIRAFEQDRMISRPLDIHILSPPHHKEIQKRVKKKSVGTRNAPGGEWAGRSKGSIQVEIVQGTLETQQVEALVSPMVFDDPLSTVVGQSLHKVVGPRLLKRFSEQKADKEVELGNSVLVEDLQRIPCKSLFFVSLTEWNEDPDGAAVEVLRLGINTILTYCDSQSLGSIAFPALGAGKALHFPGEVVAKVMLEEFSAFERDRINSAPMLLRIVVQHSDKHLSQVFKSSQEALKHRVTQQDKNQGLAPKRIILLGKTGVGKSSLANTLFGEQVFPPDHSASSGTKECKSATRSVDGRTLTLIDTPGLFDTDLSEDELRPKIMNCITECAPGPHAFLILLRVDKYTRQEQEIITQICRSFSEDALKFSVIVFTHGNQLREGMTIMNFVNQKEDLKELVKKCGGRCHVFDNDHWKNDQPNNYRSNAFQCEQLLKTIDKLVRRKKGCHYTNDMLYHIGQEIHREEVRISKLRPATQPMTPEQITQEAKSIVSQKFLIKLAAATTGALLGVFFGVRAMVRMVLSILKLPLGPPAAMVKQAALVTAAVGGGVAGGIIGARTALNATEQAENPLEAMHLAFHSVMETSETVTDPLSLGPS
ncbi:uncharacterized protein LOC114480569 isoform X2 [Gouania willdenowi]|uniref:uncharacterized protein LOC114480569 isoform X2 n=1 Tax=Gouania willdenowi TaxID=441366 RepID=UPI00105601E8|nr:uncharacterized protein LOC114480569 isoform X2 [Gouania willdenowi]